MKNLHHDWINLLTNGEKDKIREFEEVLANSKCLTLAIMKFRRMLRERGRGSHITVEHLKFGNRDEKYLQEVLEEMFLEIVPMQHLELFYKFSAERGYRTTNDAAEELFRRHKTDPNTRLLSIVLTI